MVWAATILLALAAIAAGLIRALARRVVGVEPRRKTIEVRRLGDQLEMPRSELTLAAGDYGLWFGEWFEHHAVIGPVVGSNDHRVLRHVVKSTAPLNGELFTAQWTGHVISGPAEIDPDWQDVAVPLRAGAAAPAWLFPGRSTDAPWVIHVQGIRTSRLVTLRSVEVVKQAGLTSLVITYRGAGDGPSATASTLGQTEWTDLADAVAFARAGGARSVYVVAWSMGAALALELLRREPAAFDRLALIAPATNWRRIIEHGVRRSGLPGFLASAVAWGLSSRVVAPLIGSPTPLNFDQLDWSRNLTTDVPVLVVHSQGDDEIPFQLTKEFIAALPSAVLAETVAAPHGWEANVDPEAFRSALVAWLTSSEATDAGLTV